MCGHVGGVCVDMYEVCVCGHVGGVCVCVFTRNKLLAPEFKVLV